MSKRLLENLITIAELLALPEEDRDKRIEKFYNGLREALPPPNKLLLPYTSNIKERKDILMARLAFSRLYDDADMSSENAVYKLVRGIYEDEEISFPYAFEVLAIPFKEPTNSKLDVEYIGAVNYSISPREDSNTFEGDYNGILGMGLNLDVVNIRDVLREYRFGYHHDNAKVPCLIVANLVTPRRDPHGYDKSRIDIHPFVETIVDAIRRMASGIQTYRAVGIKWVDPFNRSSAKRRIVNREDESVKEALRKFLVNERGLRDSR